MTSTIAIEVRVVDGGKRGVCPRYRVVAPATGWHPDITADPVIIAAFRHKGDAVKYAGDLAEVFRQSGYDDVELRGCA